MIITPIENKYYDCQMANIATIATSYKREFYLAFMPAFYFDYNAGHNKLVGDCIHTYCPDGVYSDSIPPLTFHGIHLCITPCEDRLSALSVIDEGIANNLPIVVSSDCYHCHWSVFYRKRHLKHMILLDRKVDRSYVAYDPYFTTDMLMIREENLFLHNNTVFAFTIMPEPKIDNCILKRELSRCIANYSQAEISIRDKGIQISQAIINVCIEKELEGTIGVYDIPLLRKLKDLEFNRILYLEMLTKIDKLHGVRCLDVCETLRHLIGLWRYIRRVLLKCCIKRSLRGKESEVEQVFTQIFCCEQAIASELYNRFQEQ